MWAWLPSWCQWVSFMSTPNFLAAALMRPKAFSRSSSETSLTWSKRAMALRTWEAFSRGSLRWSGKANFESSICLRSSAEQALIVVGDEAVQPQNRSSWSLPAACSPANHVSVARSMKIISAHSPRSFLPIIFGFRFPI